MGQLSIIKRAANQVLWKYANTRKISVASIVRLPGGGCSPAGCDEGRMRLFCVRLSFSGTSAGRRNIFVPGHSFWGKLDVVQLDLISYM